MLRHASLISARGAGRSARSIDQRVSVWIRRSLELRFMAISLAAEPRPSDQYSVNSPVRTGMMSPYLSWKAVMMSVELASITFGKAYSSFQLLAAWGRSASTGVLSASDQDMGRMS